MVKLCYQNRTKKDRPSYKFHQLCACKKTPEPRKTNQEAFSNEISHTNEPNTMANISKKQRIATHTHIKTLGFHANGKAVPLAAGFVGQPNAREASRLIVDMIRQKKMVGRALLLVVPPGIGKTALTLGIPCGSLTPT